jgi:hypothetical protein
MKRTLLLALVFSCAEGLFGATPDLHLAEPTLPIAVRTRYLGFSFLEQAHGFKISEQQRRSLDGAVLWSWMSIGGFGANALGLIVSLTADASVGGLLTLLSTGFWTASNLLNAVALRDLSRDMDYSDASSPRPTVAGWAALVSGLLGAASLTATSLSFGDTTGAAKPIAYVCIALSSIAGGYGIYRTFAYAEAAGISIEFF